MSRTLLSNNPDPMHTFTGSLATTINSPAIDEFLVIAVFADRISTWHRAILLPSLQRNEDLMDIRKQVVAEIARLNKILALLDDSDDVPVQAPRIKKLRRKISAAGRRRIAAAQKARWAKLRAQK
jgi:hypothetical protein